MADEPQENVEAEEKPAVAPVVNAPTRGDIKRFGDISLKISAIMGTSTMSVEQFLKLGRGAIVELNQQKDEHLLITANGAPIAKGEITILEDMIGVTISDLVIKKRGKKN